MQRQMIKGKHLRGMALLPAKAGTCETCATAHDKEMPHNQKSLFYQYAFYNEHGRWPTWVDAMAHCDSVTKEKWTEALRSMGEKIGDEPKEENVQSNKREKGTAKSSQPSRRSSSKGRCTTGPKSVAKKVNSKHKHTAKKEPTQDTN